MQWWQRGCRGAGGGGGTCAESEAGCAAEGEELLAGNNAGEGAPRPPSGFIDFPWTPHLAESRLRQAVVLPEHSLHTLSGLTHPSKCLPAPARTGRLARRSRFNISTKAHMRGPLMPFPFLLHTHWPVQELLQPPGRPTGDTRVERDTKPAACTAPLSLHKSHPGNSSSFFLAWILPRGA